MYGIKERYKWLKDNGLLDKDVLIPAGLAVSSHIISGWPWYGSWENAIYSTNSGVDNITHFLGGYAVSQVTDKMYEPLSRKFESIRNISKNRFVVGASLAAGGLNEVGERIALSIPGMEVFYESVSNSVKDIFVDMAGVLSQRYASRKKKS